MTTDSPVADEFIPARHFTPAGPTRPTEFVVLHSTESHVGVGARNIARWWSGAASPQTSAHYVLDDAECFQLVREMDSSWSAGHNANAYGIHIEICSHSTDGENVWKNHPSTIDRCARLIADICDRHNIPIVLLNENDLVGEMPGVTTHAAVSKAWHQSDHTDPNQWLAEEIVRRAALL